MIPLCHDLAGETVLVLGGGPVGARKARHFASESRVVVVAPSFADDDADDAFGGAERVRATPDPEAVSAHLDEYDPALVVAATDDPAVNAAAARAARERGALVNRADRTGDRPPGDVAVPATATDGDVTVAVSTDGASPALARHLRERIEREVAGAGVVGDVSGALRERFKDDGVPPDERRAAVRAVVRSEPVWRAARDGDADAAMAAAERVAAERLDAGPADAERGTSEGWSA